jgi:hypothetical protein
MYLSFKHAKLCTGYMRKKAERLGSRGAGAIFTAEAYLQLQLSVMADGFDTFEMKSDADASLKLLLLEKSNEQS